MSEKQLSKTVQSIVTNASEELLNVMLEKSLDVSIKAVGAFMETVHGRKLLEQLPAPAIKTISEKEIVDILNQLHEAQEQLAHVEHVSGKYIHAFLDAVALVKRLRDPEVSAHVLRLHVKALEGSLVAIDPDCLKEEPA